MALLPEISPRRVVAIGAHPDDLDFFAGGTLTKWASAGSEIHAYVLTDGSKGAAGGQLSGAELVEKRRHEQAAAAELLGLAGVTFGDSTDGELLNTPEVRRPLVELIRQVKPDVVVGWDPQLYYSAEHHYLNHRDHRTAGAVTLDAVWPDARNPLAFPELLETGLEPHAVPKLMWFTLSDSYNYVSDISNHVEPKRRAMAAHTSQAEAVAPFEQREQAFGQAAGTSHGEAFILIEIPS